MSSVDPLAEVTASLASVQLIPDVVPSSASFTPSVLFSVVWPNGKAALLGNELTRDETLDEPDIVFTPMWTPESGEGSIEPSYTLVMCDPDAPSRAEPKYKEFRHWVVRLSLLIDDQRTKARTRFIDNWLEVLS